MRRVSWLLCLAPVLAQELVHVQMKQLERTIKLPGELLPYQQVDLHARVAGYVEKVNVDRGSAVKAGQPLVILSAPELAAQKLEVKARAAAVRAQGAELLARLASAQSTADRLKAAAATPGVIAGNEIVVAEKQVEAIRGQMAAIEGNAKAAESAVEAIEEMEKYLTLTAPFDGTVTERIAHPGALAAPAGPALLKIEQLGRLRGIVAVPETEIGGIVPGAKVTFTVSAYPGETFSGRVARFARTMEATTRTMPVEVDIVNTGGRLAPGQYTEFTWPVKKQRNSMMVPLTAVFTTTEGTFVVKPVDGKAAWVPVKRGVVQGDMVEIVSDLQPGDRVLKRATDETRRGSSIK